MKKKFTTTGLTLIGLFAMTACASTPITTDTRGKKIAPTVAITKRATPQKTVTKATPTTKTYVNTSSKKTGGKDKHGMPTYADSARTRYLRATAYSHMEKEPGAPGRKNAEGTILKYGSTRSAAADWSRLPVGTKFKVKGNPNVTYVIDDYGSALVGTNTIDMFFPTLKGMYNWGTRKVTIQIIQMGSWSRSAKLLKGRLHAPHCRKMYYAITKKYGSSIANN